MGEKQNVEYKEVWKKEYLKWVCGFANAQGGRIYIGINDKGIVSGVKDSKQLMEDIPNMIKDTMQIIAEVNLLHKDGQEYIEIIVNPSSYPVSYNSEYHYRSGSTKQQFRGAALTEFLLSKTGQKWDKVPVDGVSVSDLDKESFDIFRREAIRSKRMTRADLDMTDEELLDSLSLIVDGKLKRAAVLLFHRKPERWVTGCYTKIGRFGKGADLLYHDEVKGSLFIQADRIVDLIYLKYLKADISYHKETRVETYPYPRDGVKEVIFNALIHSNWADSVPIQVRIEDDAMYISNSCVLPTDLTVEALLQRHRSIPYNPDIANGFFRAGLVETWGRGIQKICDECEAHGTPPPEFIVDSRGIMVKMTALTGSSAAPDNAPDGLITAPDNAPDGLITAPDNAPDGLITAPDNAPDGLITAPDNATIQDTTLNKTEAIIEFCTAPRSRIEIQNHLGLKHKQHFISEYLTPLLESKRLVMTIPDKPTSRNQKYVAKL